MDAPLDGPATDSPVEDAPLDRSVADVPVVDAPVVDAPGDTPIDAPSDTPPADAPPDVPLPPDAASDGPGDGEADATPGDAEVDAYADPDAQNCWPPLNTPEQCGSCGTRCSGTTPVCSWTIDSWQCVASCEQPLVQCSGACVDLNSDAFHCGGCDQACPSGLCQSGTCVGARAGNVVTLCMNYEESYQNQPATVLLGNAVFLPPNRPVRILAYNRYVDPKVETSVNTTIRWSAPSPGSYTISPVSGDSELLNRLSVLDYDLFLMYDQPNAPEGILASFGEGWSQSLLSFARAGGTVIVLDGGGGEMWTFLAAAGLLEVTGELDRSGSELYVRVQTNALARALLSPFLAWQRTCAFETPLVPDQSSAFVVTDTASGDLGAPVVVHRAMLPPVP
jgi:hypothetical protein